MDNNLNEKDLIIKVQEIWSENKKSQELIKYFEILLSKNKNIDVNLYLIYLNTLVNLGKHNQALLEIEDNQIMKNDKEVVAFKIKLLFFLKKYNECEDYIKNTTIDEYNLPLVERTLKQIREKFPKKEEIKTELKPVEIKNEAEEKIKTDKEKSIIDKNIILSEEKGINNAKTINSEVKKDINVANIENKINYTKKSKVKFKIIAPIITIVVILIGCGFYFINKNSNDNIAIETFINLDNNDLSEYKSNKSNIQYELPIGMEFEFVSSVEALNEGKEMYVTYKVSDENIATITEDGFFKGKQEGIVDIQTLNKNKVINTITVEISNKENYEYETINESTNDTSYEWDIQEFIKNYEKDYVKAVNEGNYNIVEKYLVKGGPLDNEHSVNIENFHKRGITERLKSLQFISVDKILDNEYLVNVKETIVIIKDGKESIREFDALYSVIKQNNGEYLISEMQIKSINALAGETSEPITSDEAVIVCTEKLKKIGWYDYSYGNGSADGGARLALSGEDCNYHKIIYDNGEVFYVDEQSKDVYYMAPSGESEGPL